MGGLVEIQYASLWRGAGSAARCRTYTAVRPAPRLNSNLVRCQRYSVKKAIDGEDERARPQSKKIKRTGELEKAIRKPIRPQVNRPHGFAVPDDPEALKRENALMEELHEKAVAAARREKLKLLSRRYSLAEDDYEGLALALAVEHEPGFQVVDRQIVRLPFGFSGSGGFSGPVRLKDGKLVDAPKRRPLQWTVERLLRLLEAVQVEKEKSGLTKDLEVLQRLAGQNEWTSANDRSNSPRGAFAARVRTLQSRLHDAKKFKRRWDELNAELNAIVEEANAEVARRKIGDDQGPALVPHVRKRQRTRRYGLRVRRRRK
jgi:hypothetical protein